jgi:nucleotide-binding universal stress UspA family protein
VRTLSAAAERHEVGVRFISGDPSDALAQEASADDVVGVVVGARSRPAGARPAGHLGLALAGALSTPVVVVPPTARPPSRLSRVLIAMEGTPAKARALKRAVELAAGADVELVVVHVDDATSIPSFSDQVQYETESYAEAFLCRYLPGAPVARVELRVGVPADEIMAVARAMDAELIALGWPHSGTPHRGDVARDVVERSDIPVLLVGLA